MADSILLVEDDPDTARSALYENSWNSRRFAELGDLIASIVPVIYDD